MGSFLDFVKPIFNITCNEDMSAHSTFGAGGSADYYVNVTDTDCLRRVAGVCEREDIPYVILGNGSNVLFTDKGYRGMVIHIGKGMSDITVNGNVITAQAGASLSSVAAKACEEGLAGLAFAGGIPGSVGGAVCMNAGAYGGEVKDVLVSVDVADRMGRVITLTKDELCLGYRRSIIQEKKYIVCSASFCLEKGDKEQIRAQMRDYNERRRTKQPLEYKSAGSTFKRPEGHYAGALIEQCNLKGYSVGEACVSEKHAGFVVNKGNASAGDILAVIKHVQETVYRETGVALELEVKVIGE